MTAGLVEGRKSRAAKSSPSASLHGADGAFLEGVDGLLQRELLGRFGRQIARAGKLVIFRAPWEFLESVLAVRSYPRGA